MIKIRRKLNFAQRNHGREVVVDKAPAVEAVPPGRIPRISRLMALAIHFDQLLSDGTVRNQSKLASLTHVTQPRITQIMNLLHLAPDIQEKILHLPRVTSGRDSISEKQLRPLTQVTDWRVQRRMWRVLMG